MNLIILPTKAQRISFGCRPSCNKSKSANRAKLCYFFIVCLLNIRTEFNEQLWCFHIKPYLWCLLYCIDFTDILNATINVKVSEDLYSHPPYPRLGWDFPFLYWGVRCFSRYLLEPPLQQGWSLPQKAHCATIWSFHHHRHGYSVAFTSLAYSSSSLSLWYFSCSFFLIFPAFGIATITTVVLNQWSQCPGGYHLVCLILEVLQDLSLVILHYIRWWFSFWPRSLVCALHRCFCTLYQLLGYGIPCISFLILSYTLLWDVCLFLGLHCTTWS